MEQQQLDAMLAMEKFTSLKNSHPKRRLIADRLHKLIDDERISDDIFALTMNLFDRFIAQTTTSSFVANDRSSQLIALSCYTIAKKLRHNSSTNNENEKTSFIFETENYRDEEIFNTEQIVAETLNWDLAGFVPHDYVEILLKRFFSEDERAKLRLHIHILLSVTICELNTLTLLPSLLACASLKAAMRGLRLNVHPPLDDLFIQTIRCQRVELIHSQCLIEQLFQSCLQEIVPSPKRRCLGPLETSPQQRTKVK